MCGGIQIWPKNAWLSLSTSVTVTTKKKGPILWRHRNSNIELGAMVGSIWGFLERTNQEWRTRGMGSLERIKTPPEGPIGVVVGMRFDKISCSLLLPSPSSLKTFLGAFFKPETSQNFPTLNSIPQNSIRVLATDVTLLQRWKIVCGSVKVEGRLGRLDYVIKWCTRHLYYTDLS